MNKLITLISVILVQLMFVQLNYAQCQLDNMPGVNLGQVSPGFSGSTTIHYGTYISLDAVQGNSYIFSTCGCPYDSQLTGYGSSGGVLFYNNDNGPDCLGAPASVHWTASATEQIKVMINLNNCQAYDSTLNTCSFQYSAFVINSVKELAEQPFLIYPNPAASGFNIETSLFISSSVKTEIKNTIGQIVYSSDEQGTPGLYKRNIDIDLAQGFYYISLQTDASRSIKKIEVIE